MNRILFLDVDGVLNSGKIIRHQGMYGLGSEQLRLLKLIANTTGCHMVLSSSWRLYDNLRKTLRIAFDQHQIPHWIGQTPDLGDVPRRDEIVSWLNDHSDPASIVVLDDDSAAMPITAPPNFSERLFVHTSFDTGLTRGHADAVLDFWWASP